MSKQEPHIIALHEHEFIKEEDSSLINDCQIRFQKTEYLESPIHLGLYHDQDKYENSFSDIRASYYIGTDWLKDDVALTVLPKNSSIDYTAMFLSVLNFPQAENYFSLFYGVDENAKTIDCQWGVNNIIPLMLLHYLSFLNHIAKKGLKHNYVLIQEILNLKIKGKILLQDNIAKNTCLLRNDRIFCQYQKYLTDCEENRLLKKAFLITMSYLKNNLSKKHLNNFSKSFTGNIYKAFEDVSDNINIRTVNQTYQKTAFKHYYQALKLAKIIIKQFHYSVRTEVMGKYKVPVFWIDMSRLYEVYIYSKLYKSYGKQIMFQVKGNYNTAVDFIKQDERLIIDTKYKFIYGNEGVKIEDIRQISSYARDMKIISQIGINENDDKELKCIIIHPSKENEKGVVDFDKNKTLLSYAKPMKAFRNFFTIEVSLPKLSYSSK
ncbi:MAG: hypothetical protein IJ213_06320 [Bacteroidales bacterium]|nr:hypothetical protein [Bacteroidales bacterium]